MNKNSFKLGPSRILALFLGITIVVAGNFVHSLGIRPFDIAKKIISPVSSIQAKPDIRKKINEGPKNTFNLKASYSLVEKADAASEVKDAKSYIVVDQDSGEVLFEKEPDKSMPIASLTKVMSAVVALDLKGHDELLTINSKAAKQIPTKIGVVPGQKMKVSELLQAMLLTSANDAAQAVNDEIDMEYGKGAFVSAMNEKARILGLSHTNFANPQGFDSPDNYSSASDLAVLSAYALKNYPLIKSIVQKDYALLSKDQNHKQFDLYNWNGLLGVYPGALGVKIGNTGEAGTTTIVSSKRGGKQLLTVVLGTHGILERDMAASQLLDMGFEQSAGLPPVKLTEQDFKDKYSTWKYFN